MLLLTTKARLKEFISPTNTAKLDAADDWLDAAAAGYSAAFEDYLSRGLEFTQRTDRFTPDGHRCRFPLRAYPVVSLDTVTLNGTVATTGFALNARATAIEWSTAPVRSGLLFLDVLYTGGLADDVDAVVPSGGTGAATAWLASTAYSAGNRVRNGSNTYQCTTGGTSASSGGPTGTDSAITDGTVVWAYKGTEQPALVLAIERQISAAWRTRETAGKVTQQSAGGTSVTVERPDLWLADVVQVLRRYRRLA